MSTSTADTRQARPTALRSRLLRDIDPDRQPLPRRPAVAYVWPTELCGIGCAHCSFGSVRQGPAYRRLLALHPERLVAWLTDAGARKLVACGGGEPLGEPEFLVRALAAATAARLPFEIYTAGVPSNAGRSIDEYLRDWTSAAEAGPDCRPLRLRLSVDRFHEERLGLEPVLEWITRVDEQALPWTLGIRSLRLANDDSVERLAARLGAALHRSSPRAGRIVLRSGRQLTVEWKGFVFEHRGSMRLLAHRGLELTAEDEARIAALSETHGPGTELGRPLSAPLTVSRRVLDLEIHSDCIGHVLESQSPDLHRSFLDTPWAEMRAAYYRDPLLHCIAHGGLPALAHLIDEARLSGPSSEGTVPYSLERVTDTALLDWITARAVLTNSSDFGYPATTIAAARAYLAAGDGAFIDAGRSSIAVERT